MGANDKPNQIYQLTGVLQRLALGELSVLPSCGTVSFSNLGELLGSSLRKR